MYVLQTRNKIAIGKLINHTKFVYDNEIEITEEQYNQINEFPLQLTIEDEKVVAWEKTELPYEEYVEPVQELTSEERIAALEMAMSFMLGM